jgi:hypothetical protein
VFLVLFALLAVSPLPARAQSLLFDYVGFDYENPDLNPSTFGETGSGYVSIGLVPVLFAPLTFDTSENEYTYVLTGPVATGSAVFGDYVIIDYSGGTLALYEDDASSGTPADYGVNPPNATAPSTFSDGTLILLGTLEPFQFIFNTVTNTGSFEAVYNAVGGSQLGNIPADDRDGWTFAGTTGNSTQTPEGYEHQVDGQVLLNKPTPARVASWGAIKARYRGTDNPSVR